MSNITIKGFVDITVFNEDGTVKEHQYKENTLTHAALASMFCDFLFRGDSSGYGSANSSDTLNESYLAYLEKSNASNKDPGVSPRDRILQGTNGLKPVTPVFSHRQPARLGIYCLSTFIQNESALEPGQLKFDYRTQVAPYLKPDGATLSDYAVFYNTGTNETDFYPADETTAQHFVRSLVDCSFNLPEITFTTSFRKTIGTGTVRSIVWGAAHPTNKASADSFQRDMFDVRARILSKSNFNFAGYSPFYATEQRLVQTGETVIPHTILWQDAMRPNGYNYDSSLSDRQIFGYDLTVPGANDSAGNIGVEKLSVSDWQYMSRYMQGVIIGENAFGLDHDTATADTPSIFFTINSGVVKVKVYKVSNWKTQPVTTSKDFEFTDGGSSYSPIQDTNSPPRGVTKPVMAHNLQTGYLELFFTPSYNTSTKKFRVGRIVIDPISFNQVGSPSYFESDFCISNYRLSMPGTSTTKTDSNYPRARAVSGFIDYNTNPTEYYLPYTIYYDSVTNVHLTLPSTSLIYEPGQFSRLGVQCTFNNAQLVPIRLYVQGYASSGRGYPAEVLSSEYGYTSTAGVFGAYRYNLWAYTPPSSASSESAIQPPIQFIPLTGNAYTTGSFSMVSPSQVMCGLDLDQPVTKGESEVLLLSYGWKISQATPETI